MTKTARPILLIIIILYSGNIFCRNQDSIQQINEARLLFNQGAGFLREGRYAEAKDPLLSALEIRKSHWGEIVPDLYLTYFYLGYTSKNLGQLEQALHYYRLAEKCALLDKTGATSRLARIYNNFGNIYSEKLDYYNALKFYEQAIFYYEQDPNMSKADIAFAYLNVATMYYITNNFQKAINIIHEFSNTAYIEDKILYYQLLGKIYQVTGNYSSAKSNYDKAINLAKKFYGNKSIEVARVFLDYAARMIATGQTEEAAEMLEKSFQIIQGSHNEYFIEFYDYYRYYGLLHLYKSTVATDIVTFNNQRRNNILKSIEYYRKGLSVLQFPDDYKPDSLINLDEIIYLTGCIELFKRIGDNYLELSKLEEKQGELSPGLKNAIEQYRIVGSLIQQARRELKDEASKIQLTSLEYESFIKLIQAAHTAYSVTKDSSYVELAFLNAERTRGSALFDKISEDFALENSIIPDSLLDLEAKLNYNINIYSQRLQEQKSNPNPDTSLINQYNAELLNATNERDRLTSYLETEYSDFYELKYAKAMLSVKDIQQKLNKDQVLLEYVLNETDTLLDLYTFVISADNVDFVRRVVPAKFSLALESAFKFMSSTNYLYTKNEDAIEFCTASNYLYSELIKPVENKIAEKNLIIVPDGKLSYIPFDALVESLPDTSKMIEFNKLDYLIKKYQINYAISSNLLFRDRENTVLKKVKALAFAPSYNGETLQLAGLNLKLLPLPGVKREVDNISEIVNTKSFFDTEANELNFRNNIADFDILHLAMHAFINDSLPAFSSLVFTPKQNNADSTPDLINTADIYNLKLKAKLTVLSACNTGTGKLLKGEGIMSLARGFLFAGCPSIIMSLWEVEDASGTQIMTSFYKNLKKGKSKDEALRDAKLEYLQSVNSRRAHPHYWLGFVNIGDSAPLFISYDFYFFILLILALSGIGIDQFLRIKKARKTRA